MTAIVDALGREGLVASRSGLAKFLRRDEQTGSLERCRRPSKVTLQALAIVEAQMQDDNETTATQLRAFLSSKGYSLSPSTLLRRHFSLGWTFCGSAYCLMILEANKLKRLYWARKYAHEMGF